MTIDGPVQSKLSANDPIPIFILVVAHMRETRKIQSMLYSVNKPQTSLL